jgi:hypothetical protein
VLSCPRGLESLGKVSTSFPSHTQDLPSQQMDDLVARSVPAVNIVPVVKLISCRKLFSLPKSRASQGAPSAASVLAYPNHWRHKQLLLKLFNFTSTTPIIKAHQRTSRWLQMIKKVCKVSALMNFWQQSQRPTIILFSLRIRKQARFDPIPEFRAFSSFRAPSDMWNGMT